ncbi:CCT motif family protein [Striga hermonthica]|uniref:CCT motif family protein n=1 Tax=Striga hermonthica TaxID=68872 RepID=A0A9N7RLZ3_STRHE|nr:CCT motif family protein [Striga hermonthica]
MYGQNNNNDSLFPYNYSPELIQAQFPLQILPPLAIPDSLYTSSGCSSYGGSPTSMASCYSPTIIHPTINESTSFSKPHGTGDLLQGMNMGQRSNGPLATESSIIESMSRASPYSPEEKKERIERYRSKRNLRNFNKKIKYECRKTLADSRPRIRGRFARNDETEKTAHNQWEQSGVDEDDEDEANWINLLDAFSANMMP